MKAPKPIFLCAAVLIVFLLALCGCRETAADADLSADGADLDLTRLSGTMVYSQVYNMRYDPEPYYGKVIRISGYFDAYPNPYTGEYYYNCIIPDATACCSQGIQFFPAEDLVYPDDFPENGTTVTVLGTFERNEANLYACSLCDAVIESVAEE